MSTNKIHISTRLSQSLVLAFLLSFTTIAFSGSQSGIDTRFQQILDLSSKGDREAYRTALIKFIEENPKGELTDLALFKLTELYVAQENWRKGMDSAQTLLKDFPLSNFKNDALYLLAFSHMKSGMLGDAKMIAEGLLKGSPDTLSPALKIKTEDMLKEIVAMQTPRPLPQVSASKVHSRRIGVILPLSGKYGGFGEQALKGMVLAAGIFESKGITSSRSAEEKQEAEAPAFELIIRDTKDDPLASAKAVEELAETEEVAGIVGPLLSVTAEESAKKAQELKVPVVSLSQKPGLTGVGDYVFRNFLSHVEQIQSIVDYAVNSLQYKKFALLYPTGPYGTELAQLFKERVMAAGGEIVAEEQYREGQTYFGKEIVRLFKIKETEKKEGRRSIKTFESAVMADALFIPDYYDTIGLIAPHLAYYNVKEVKLLGANGWNSPKLVELGGKFVEGAVFTDGFFINSKREETARFVNMFKNVYGIEPGIIEAQAYDATKMIIEAILKGGNTREEIRQNLESVRSLQGTAGAVSFNKEREAIKELFLLTVKNGKIVEIN